jgi:hypothetical protein
MKLFAVLFLAVVGIAWNAEARLGETKEKCEERYGKPLKEEDVGDAQILAYKKGEYTFYISFLGGKADWMVIIKDKLWEVEEAKVFINKNATSEGFVLRGEESSVNLYLELSSRRIATFEPWRRELALYASFDASDRRQKQFTQKIDEQLQGF